MDQSELEANACNRRKARENAWERGTVGFASHLLRKWREFCQPITERSKDKPMHARNYFRHSIENNSNEQKQSLCTCVLHFDTFLCRPRQNNNVK